ncbi:MAG: hypothetical protein LBI27_04205 [Clostridiales bacterium]|jgi:hypothetical protein|nr:hypothetical protein [Clostridiales bacterium]
MGRKALYVEISADGMVAENEYIPFSSDIFSDDFDFGEIKRIEKANSSVIVANTRKTAIRVADISHIADFSKKNYDRWNLIENNFPIGDRMNENTHVFDGCVFNGDNGQSRFFMTALPVSACDVLAKIGVQLTGSIHRVARIDTIEHVLFERYVEETEEDESVLIFHPQDNGIRILHIENKLPNAAHYISNHPAHRENEFHRFYNSIKKPEIKTRAIYLGENMDFADFLL